MTIKGWFQSHGFGVTQTSQSWTSGLFSRTTKTPVTPYESKVRPDGVDREVLRLAKKKIAVKESELAHIHYGQDNLKGETVDLQMHDGWLNVLGSEAGFRFPGSTQAELGRLITQMGRVEDKFRGPFSTAPDARKDPKDQRVLPGTSMMVLLNASSNVSRTFGLTAEQAANALACLQHVDMLNAIQNPFGAAAAVPNPLNPNGTPREPRRTDGNNFDAQDLANAWRLAIELEDSGESGFNLIKQLMNQPPPPAHGVHPTVGRQRDALLHTYLQAAGQKTDEAAREAGVGVAIPLAAQDNRGRLMPDPQSVHTHVNNKLNPGALINVEPGVAPADGIHVQGNIGGRILPSGSPNPAADATLVDKALKAVSNHLDQVQNHAANPAVAGRQITFDLNHGDIREGTPANTYVILNKDCNWWAANAVRTGIYSDNPDRSKLYSKLQNRADKMTTWLQRANQNTGGAGLSRWQRAGRQIRQAVLPRKNKTPFNAHNNIVVDSPHRLRNAADEGGIMDGQTIRQNLIWTLDRAISQGFVTPARTAVYPPAHPKAGQPAIPDNATVPNSNQVLRQMVRLAILKQQCRFNEEGNGTNLFITRHNDGDPLEGQDIKRAKERLYNMFAGGEAGQNGMTQLYIDHLFTQENVQLSPERLLEWAGDAGDPGGLHAAYTAPAADENARRTNLVNAITAYHAAPGVPPANWSQADWDKFVDGVNRVLAHQVEDLPHGITDLTNLTQTQIAELFEEIISRQRLGHLMDMRDGGWVGIKTQGLSYILSRIVTLGSVGIGVDVRLLHGKHADMQTSTGTGGSDLFLGTVKATRSQAGAGASVGPGHVSKKADGFSFGLAAGGNLTPFSGEWAEKIGALFRFRRVFSGVDSDDIRNAQLGRLTRKLMDPTNAPANGGAWINPGDPNDQDILKQVLHEFDDVSVGWLNSKENTYKVNGSASAVLGFKVGGWGPALGAGLGAEYSRTTTKWREEGGSLNQERDIKASQFKVTVSGILSTVAVTLKELNLEHDESLKGLLDPDRWDGVFKAAFQDGAAGSADIFRYGTSRRHTWISHDGALTYTPGICSFYQKTHKNAAAFASSLVRKIAILGEQRKIEALAADKAYVFEGHKHATTEERLRAIDKERRKMLEDLKSVLTTAKPTQEFREYYEYSPKYLQMINDLQSLIKSEKNAPDWKRNRAARFRVKDYEKQLAELKSLDDEAILAHGQYRFNITDNVESKLKGKGLNAFAVNWHENLFATSRIDTYT